MGCGSSKSVKVEEMNDPRAYYNSKGTQLDKQGEAMLEKIEDKVKHGVDASKEIQTLNSSLFPTPKAPRCPKEHKLIQAKKSEPWSCAYCDKSIGDEPYMCKMCGFYLCKICFSWEAEMIKSQLEFIKCGKNHTLYVTTITKLVEFYQSYSGEKGATCAGCKKYYNDSFNDLKLYHCRRCRLEICQGCVEKVHVFKRNEAIKCSHELPIKWNENEFSGYMCTKCGGEYSRAARFETGNCECKYCIRCAFELV